MDERLAGYLAVLSDDGHPVVDSAATLTRGQFHDVVLAGEVAYRFPRDQQTCRRLPTRVALLAELSRCQLRVQVPEPLDTSHLDRPAGGCYVAVRRLHGEPAVRGQITGERAQAGLASQAAGLLDELAVLGRAAEVRRVVPLAGTEQWPEWGAQVRRVLFPLMSSAGRRRAEAELSAVAAVSGSGEALVHSDLGGANLLLTRRSGVPMITGVLDWDEACIGNQANDLASLAVTFGWPVAERIDAVRQGGGAVPPMVGAAKLIAATFALQQALPAALSGDRESLDDGLSGYR